MKMFGARASGYLTPDPPAFCPKGMDAVPDALDGSGSQTPRFICKVDMDDLQGKLKSLQSETERNFSLFGGPPPGLSSSSILDADVMKVAMSTNLQAPYPAFSAVPPSPDPHPELQFVRNDRVPALKAKPMMSRMMPEQVVSKGSVGHPFKCAPACKYVKRKDGCRDGEDCPNCHHCFWAKAHAAAGEGDSLATPQGEDDARLREAKSLANQLVSLLGGEEPFGVKAQATVKPDVSLGTMGHPHTCAEPCKYVRRKGGCMYGNACKNCHACLWSRPSGQKAEAEAPSFFGTSYGEAVPSGQKAEAEAPNFFGTSYGEAVQYGQEPGSLINRNDLFIDPDAAPILSTNPAWGHPQAFPEPQSAPQQVPQPMPKQLVPWCASIGSMGHPYSCGPACKYAMKAKGCKDGAMCDHCHLCRWTRYG